MNGTPQNVLMDNWSGRRTSTLDVLEVLGFALLTAVLAHVRIPLPFTPVPITGQTFGVLLAGATLGARRGFLSQCVYLAAGAAGLNFFFAHGSLLGPTAGYLWSFPLAAGLAGWLVERGAARNKLSLAASLAAADACILAGGALWLRALLGISLGKALVLGLAPFWAGDLLKISLVALALPVILKLSRHAGDSR